MRLSQSFVENGSKYGYCFGEDGSFGPEDHMLVSSNNSSSSSEKSYYLDEFPGSWTDDSSKRYPGRLTSSCTRDVEAWSANQLFNLCVNCIEGVSGSYPNPCADLSI